MLGVFKFNRDKYLKNILNIKYVGSYNNIKKDDKYNIIDDLVKDVQEKNCEKSLIGLILIFEAVFKSLNRRFVGTLSHEFGYTSDEFMTILLSHFYEITRYEYCRKGSDAFVANFNRFVYIKLKSKALCLLSKEKINRRHIHDMFDDCDIGDVCAEDNTDDNFIKDKFHKIKDSILVSLFKDKNYSIYKLFFDGFSDIEISRMLRVSLKKIKMVLNDFRIKCRENFKDLKCYLDI